MNQKSGRLLAAEACLKELYEHMMFRGPMPEEGWATEVIQKYIDLAVNKETKVQSHTLKCWPQAFDGIWSGDKRHDYRKNDRGFAVGDELIHLEYDPETEKYSGRECRSRVTYLSTSEDPWGIPKGYCVMSLSEPYGQQGTD